MASITPRRPKKSTALETRTTIYLRSSDRHLLTMHQTRHGFIPTTPMLRQPQQRGKE